MRMTYGATEATVRHTCPLFVSPLETVSHLEDAVCALLAVISNAVRNLRSLTLVRDDKLMFWLNCNPVSWPRGTFTVVDYHVVVKYDEDSYNTQLHLNDGV